MKKLIVSLSALALLATACEKADVLKTEELTTIRAYAEDANDTKATLNDNFNIVWKTGDYIRVVIYNPEQDGYKPWEKSFVLESGDGSTVADFKIDGEGSFTSAEKFNAIYPQFTNNFGNSQQADNAYFAYQTEYDFSAGTSFAPMIAYGSQSLNFKHVGGLVRITISNISVAASKVSLTCDKNITGWYTFVASNAGSEGVTSGNENSGTAGKTVTFNIGQDPSYRTLVLYFPVPILTSPSFELNILDGNGNALFTKKASNQQSIGRAEILSMKALAAAYTTTTSEWAIVGPAVGSSWDEPVAMKQIDGTNWYVAENVTCNNNCAFKFKKGDWAAQFSTGGDVNADAIITVSYNNDSTFKGANGVYDIYLSTDGQACFVSKD